MARKELWSCADLKKLFHCSDDFHDVRLDCKMTRIQKLDVRVREILSKCLSSCGSEKGVVFAPDRQQRRLRVSKVLLKLRIELHVGCVVEKQIKLNLLVSRSFHQSRIQCVGLRRNTFWIGYAVGVLPAG